MYCVVSHSQEMDLEGQIQGHVHRSKRYLEEMYDQGAAILVNMAGNRERLKVGAEEQAGALRAALGSSAQREARVPVLYAGVQGTQGHCEAGCDPKPHKHSRSLVSMLHECILMPTPSGVVPMLPCPRPHL